MNRSRLLACSLATIALTGAAGLAQAQALDQPEAAPQATAWTDWTSETATTMSGTLTLASGTVRVKFSGPAIFFSQLGEAGNGDYWRSGTPDAYAATGRPSGTDIIGFTGGTEKQKYTITFSKPVTNPVMAILSLGGNNAPARYIFGQTPTVLSTGVGYYGGCATCLSVKKKTLSGTEGHGVVQFIGTFRTISWTEPDYENWHGITVGAPIVAP
ncbi:MAG TPA: hypothetical protein VLA16_19375 [Ideonella sp.]|nr:hypothetical protein [Ideonella sp.]